jgi:hypothetical protein
MSSSALGNGLGYGSTPSTPDGTCSDGSGFPRPSQSDRMPPTWRPAAGIRESGPLSPREVGGPCEEVEATRAVRC